MSSSTQFRALLGQAQELETELMVVIDDLEKFLARFASLRAGPPPHRAKNGLAGDPGPAAQGRIFSLPYPHLQLRVRSPSVGANLWSRLTALDCRNDSIIVCPWVQVGVVIRDGCTPEFSTTESTNGSINRSSLPFRAAEQFPRRALKIVNTAAVFRVLQLGMACRGRRIFLWGLDFL